MNNDILILIPRNIKNTDRDNYLIEAINSVKEYPVLICPDINQLGPANAICNSIKKINLPKYIGILDDDDYVEKGTVKEFYKQMEQAPMNPFCCADFFAIKDGIEIQYDFKMKYPTTETLKLACGIRGFKLFRTAFVEAVGGFDPTIKINYDYDIMRRLAIKFGCPIYIDKKMSYYRIHENQITQNINNNITPYFNWIQKRPQ